MIAITSWLSSRLRPGLNKILAEVGRLFRRGRQYWRPAWSLGGAVAIGLFGLLLIARGWWLLGVFVMGLAFAGVVALALWLIRRVENQRAEIDCLRRLAEEPSDRIAILSHDIRTPLTIIKGRLEQLSDGHPGPLTPLQVEFLRAADKECERAIALVKDLLIQARIGAGIFQLHPELVDIRAVARQVVASIRPLAAKRQQVINLDYPQVMEPIDADPGLLANVLTNLLNNASRYTSQGGHIYVTIADNGVGVVISVMDDGAGMTTEERQALFQPFASSRQFGDGIGLGLVITRQIIELHGGKILVDASLGRGTTVLFTIPRQHKQESNKPVIPCQEEKENGEAAHTGG